MQSGSYYILSAIFGAMQASLRDKSPVLNSDVILNECFEENILRTLKFRTHSRDAVANFKCGNLHIN